MASFGVVVLKVVMCTVLITMVAMVDQSSGAMAMTCGQAVQSVLPCLGYLVKGGAVTPACCNGVTALARATLANPADLRTACACLKAAAPAYGANFGYASQLPAKCKVNIGFQISASMDCSKLH